MNKFIKKVWAALHREPKREDLVEAVIEAEAMAKGIEAVHAAAGIKDKDEAQRFIDVVTPVMTLVPGPSKPVVVVDDRPRKFREPAKPRGVKCMLPGCSILTLHNGGYCCAEHCRDDRQRLRAQKSA